MIRRIFAPIAVLALLAATPQPPLALSLRFARTSFDLLDPVGIQLIVDNPSESRRDVAFASPNEYSITIYRGNKAIWHSAQVSTARAAPLGGTHARNIAPGASIFVTYVWSALAGDGASPAQGRYRVVADFEGVGAHLRAERSLRFIAPLAPSAVAALPVGSVATIAGRLDPDRDSVSAAGHSLQLSRIVRGIAAGRCIVVRGQVTAMRGVRGFDVSRSAPLRADGRAHDCAPVAAPHRRRSR
ncbi:MAG: hypothetical protein HKL91_03115 [Candidatus Eremiobacteraeota bacterium]|uniref:Uncharacterized protein n=1 Tax=mine drainage metagenome TaxID=410659 RepID=E6Q3U7_9ZZZZ|nr:hypothetical protein [Candidatus Eremiobacteraeota bacterium]